MKTQDAGTSQHPVFNYVALGEIAMNENTEMSQTVSQKLIPLAELIELSSAPSIEDLVRSLRTLL